MAKSASLLGAAVFLILCQTVLAHSRDAQSLDGTWVTTDGSYMFWNRQILDVPKDLVITLEIDTSNFPSLFITMTEEFAPDAFAGWHGSQQIQGTLTFQAVGVVSFDGQQIHIADVFDTTRWFCDVRGFDRMECLATEAGERALSGRIALTKQ